MHIGCNRDESMTSVAEPINGVHHLRGAFASASGDELVSAIESNNLYGESNAESRLSPRRGADVGWERRLERAES
jgi:hypothetical protein